MSKIKVLTVQFDVTHLDKGAVDSLTCALISQGEDIAGTLDQAEIFNTSVREVETEDL